MAADTKRSPKQQVIPAATPPALPAAVLRLSAADVVPESQPSPPIEKLPDNIIERRVIQQKLGPREYKIEVFFLPYPSEERRREAYKKWVDALFL